MQARKLETRPGEEMQISTAQIWAEETRWPRGSRLVFVVLAAAACWAVPVALIYFLAS